MASVASIQDDDAAAAAANMEDRPACCNNLWALCLAGDDFDEEDETIMNGSTVGSTMQGSVGSSTLDDEDSIVDLPVDFSSIGFANASTKDDESYAFKFNGTIGEEVRSYFLGDTSSDDDDSRIQNTFQRRRKKIHGVSDQMNISTNSTHTKGSTISSHTKGSTISSHTKGSTNNTTHTKRSTSSSRSEKSKSKKNSISKDANPATVNRSLSKQDTITISPVTRPPSVPQSNPQNQRTNVRSTRAIKEERKMRQAQKYKEVGVDRYTIEPSKVTQLEPSGSKSMRTRDESPPTLPSPSPMTTTNSGPPPPLDPHGSRKPGSPVMEQREPDEESTIVSSVPSFLNFNEEDDDYGLENEDKKEEQKVTQKESHNEQQDERKNELHDTQHSSDEGREDTNDIGGGQRISPSDSKQEKTYEKASAQSPPTTHNKKDITTTQNNTESPAIRKSGLILNHEGVKRKDSSGPIVSKRLHPDEAVERRHKSYHPISLLDSTSSRSDLSRTNIMRLGKTGLPIAQPSNEVHSKEFGGREDFRQSRMTSHLREEPNLIVRPPRYPRSQSVGRQSMYERDRREDRGGLDSWRYQEAIPYDSQPRLYYRERYPARSPRQPIPRGQDYLPERVSRVQPSIDLSRRELELSTIGALNSSSRRWTSNLRGNGRYDQTQERDNYTRMRLYESRDPPTVPYQRRGNAYSGGQLVTANEFAYQRFERDLSDYERHYSRELDYFGRNPGFNAKSFVHSDQPQHFEPEGIPASVQLAISARIARRESENLAKVARDISRTRRSPSALRAQLEPV